MEKKLLIVESPAKAKTIGKYLGGDFVVKASVGHVRDLPKANGAIKIAENGPGAWKFTPTYEVSEGKEKVVADLRKATKAADAIYLASDPDREGEAIAWHLEEVLRSAAGGKPFRRVTYNEITKSAVLKAVESPRDVDMALVDAQQARRILDRLVGYKVSPLLWKNVSCPNSKTLSAGRVQSVALRLLVERQREIDAFVPETYHLLGVEARRPGDDKSFVARLARLDGKKPDIREKETVNRLVLDLAGASLRVADVKSQPKTRHALPPFTTSTLQQAASSVLGYSPGKTMKIAQALYEKGFITYMRTDSVHVSDQAREAAKAFVVDAYGERFYPEKPNLFSTKAKGGVAAQEAHEAIRPTDVARTPDRASSEGLDSADLRVYDLVWRRFVASQMADAKTTVRTLSIEAQKPALAHSYLFTASATTVDFEGFLKVMQLSLKKKAKDGEDDEDTDEVAYLPAAEKGDPLEARRWICDEKQTKGPAHYSEASLIKALEENGVGRPSTYAQTIETLKARAYATSEKRKLVPQERGILVCDWLVKNMDDLFSVGFTARMEAELDKVERAEEPMDRMLSDFYGAFLKSLPPPPPPPDAAKFELVLSMLGEVREWKEPKRIGKREYNDEKFYLSCREQFEKGERPMSARQLEFLVRMAILYDGQIDDCVARLRDAGLAAGVSLSPKADPELVAYCFELMDRIGGMERNPFIKSLRDQAEHGRPLSQKQFVILARAVGENAGALPDVDEVRARLSQYVPEGFGNDRVDPAVPRLLEMFKSVKEWRPKAKRGKRVYDDKVFVTSLGEQYARRHSLSPRQIQALRRVAVVYRAQIPDYDRVAHELGLREAEREVSEGDGEHGDQ